MYVDPDAGTSVNLSLSVSWTVLNISVKPGRLYDNPVSGGVGVNFPADSNHYHVYCRRKYVVEYIYVEEYRGTEIISTYYLTRHRLLSAQYYLKQVN